jgi:hypothetical protein
MSIRIDVTVELDSKSDSVDGTPEPDKSSRPAMNNTSTIEAVMSKPGDGKDIEGPRFETDGDD